MNPLEHHLQYPDLPLPAAGELGRIAEGIGWVRMPLPFALDHINLWLLDDPQDGVDGWTQVDCGIASKDIRAAWQQVLDGPMAAKKLHRVLVTHMHPDHVGLAGMLTRRDGGLLWMTSADYALGRVLSTPGENPDASTGDDGAVAHFRRHGVVDPTTLDLLSDRRDYFTTLVPDMPRRYRRILDGERIRIGGATWEVIVGRGHSPEHASLYCAERGVLISGDMMLPRISTNVSVWAIEPEANPLQLFIDSIERLRDLPADTLVLPSHGRPFRGLHTRIDQLVGHHQERLDEVRQACAAAPQSAADIVPLMFKRKLDTHQLTFAMGEALAHLHLLWYAGALRRQWCDDQVYRFSPA